MVDTVLYLFETCVMSPSVNSTNLILIPEVNGPKELSHYKPIGLCKFIYKVVPKVLVNRPKIVLPSSNHYFPLAECVYLQKVNPG